MPSFRLKSRELATASLSNLVRMVAAEGGDAALAELHDHRTIFAISDEHDLLFAELVSRLADRAARQGWVQTEIDAAVSLTTDRFTQLANGGSGLDCRNTFRAVVSELAKLSRVDSLTEDMRVAAILNGYVRRHFKWALREARRSGARTRFVWRVGGGEIRLLMPETVSGSARAKWLIEHVPDVDPFRPRERERVQAIVDLELSAQPVSIDTLAVADPTVEVPWRALDRVSEHGLAACVAEEKAGNLDELRPSIAKLGSEGVRNLVLMLFERIGDDDTTSDEIASKFGLTTAALSRFAGKLGPNRTVPDLWKNLARLLAANDRFREVCADAGVWAEVQRIVSPTPFR